MSVAGPPPSARRAVCRRSARVLGLRRQMCNPARDRYERAVKAPEADLYPTFAKALYLGAALAVLLWFLYQIQQVVLVFALAAILGLAVNAPVTWMEYRGVSRGWGTLLVTLVVLIVAGGVGWLIVPRLLDEVPRLIDELPELIAQVAARLASILGDHPAIERQLLLVAEWGMQIIGNVWQHVDALIAAFVLFLFIVALVLFMVSNPRPLLETYLRALPPRFREPGVRAFARGSAMVVGWVFSNFIIGSIKAVAVFLFLTFLGVPGAPLWSLLAFFAALVPRVGVYLMTIPPALVALSIDFATALWVVLFFWGFSEVLGNFIAPRIYEETMSLHPVLLLLMTLALAYAFGLVGVLVAPPAAGFAKAYFDEFYLSRQPEDPESDRKVQAMLLRSTGD
jgi:putative permease